MCGTGNFCADAPRTAVAPLPRRAVLGRHDVFRAIATDVQSIVATGDLAAAKTRINDLETAWDNAQPALQPVNPADWGNVDGAIDDALTALRADTGCDHSNGDTCSLQSALADPSMGGAVTAGPRR